MKRYINLLILFSLIFFTACRGDEEWTMTNSGFLISLGEEQANITSRATPAELGKPVADMFQLKITKKETNNVIYNGVYKSGIIEASTGNYTLTAFCGDNPELAWDTPYYEGTTEAEVQTDQTTSVTIPCRVANALLSIKFSNPEKFATLYSSYGVKVKVGSSSLIFENSETKKSAYFRAQSQVGLTFYATLQETGKDVSMVIENESLPQTFAAGTHTKLSLTAATPTSGTILEVDKVEVEKVTVTQTIPLEWLPKPKVTGFGGNAVFNYTETADAPSEAVINYTASSPVQDVEFTLDFKDPQYTGYNKTYTLSKLTKEERTTLSSIGIKLPELDNTSKEGQLDLSALTANLLTDNGTEVTNTLKFKVKANNRWSSKEGENYQIKVVKPEFTVTVRPGNIWCKEFTIDEINVTSGNIEKMKPFLVYLYSADNGITWQECSNTRQQIFNTIPTNRNYKVKACYRNYAYASNVADVILAPLTQIPNSDMEIWQTKELGKTGFLDGSKKFYDFLPYSDNNDIWWTTNNERARDYSVSRVKITSSACVSYTENNKHEGSRAALIYTSGHGGTYASSSLLVLPDGAFAGSLFIGTYKWDKGETISTGHAFTSRPQEFSFWYKYAPKGSDQFKAYIELKNQNDIIATGTFIPAAYSNADSEFKQANIQLDYIDIEKEATSIYIQFLSTTKTSFSTDDFDKNKSITFPVMGSWNAHIGSMLYIDDLHLEYTK
ncbi:DUF4493 domain-containing protein [Bacteroides sp.]|uniref:DUF4493 domain-containing protein n=1 Tax=Bacteroides sp. TaxID=29523 RepID=UPI0026091CE9|nr:DUF4493 domain-containing protein [Bacteroides sp.]